MMGFDCRRFDKVEVDTEFLSMVDKIDDEVCGSVTSGYDTDYNFGIQSFYKIRDPEGDTYNAVSLATGKQYYFNDEIEVFIWDE